MALVLMAVIILLVNSFWLIPILQFFQDKTIRPENYTFTLQIDNPLEPLNVYLRQQQSILYRKIPQLNNTFIETILLLFGIGGFYYMWKARSKKLMLSMLGGTIFLFVIAYYGSHTNFFPQLQPQRFTIPLNIFLIIPASICMFLMFQSLLAGRSKPVVCFSYSPDLCPCWLDRWQNPSRPSTTTTCIASAVTFQNPSQSFSTGYSTIPAGREGS